MTDYAKARQHMVDSQVKTNRVIDDRVIEALSSLPRERFVPKASAGIAYIDEDIHIGSGRYLMEPMIIARLLEESRPTQSDLALVVGAGAGYGTAALASMVETVVALEADTALANTTQAILSELGIDNAAVVEGTLADGYPSQGPYDLILVDGAVGWIPDDLLQQLKDNGRMLVVVSERGPVGEARIYRKAGGHISHRVLFDAATPILPGFEPKPAFQF